MPGQLNNIRACCLASPPPAFCLLPRGDSLLPTFQPCLPLCGRAFPSPDLSKFRLGLTLLPIFPPLRIYPPSFSTPTPRPDAGESASPLLTASHHPLALPHWFGSIRSLEYLIVCDITSRRPEAQSAFLDPRTQRLTSPTAQHLPHRDRHHGCR